MRVHETAEPRITRIPRIVGKTTAISSRIRVIRAIRGSPPPVPSPVDPRCLVDGQMQPRVGMSGPGGYHAETVLRGTSRPGGGSITMSTTQPNPPCPESLRAWLAKAVELEASDLHVVSGYAPVVRVHGVLRELQPEVLDSETVRRLLVELCPAISLDRFGTDRNVDFALELPWATTCSGSAPTTS